LKRCAGIRRQQRQIAAMLPGEIARDGQTDAGTVTPSLSLLLSR